ncbi:MAG: glycerophosphoryl diester phosphodiesterase membrane domain-containing protein [Clostridium sp.]
MEGNKQIIKNSFKNFNRNFKNFVFFEALYKLLALFIFIPLNYLVLNNFMGNVGVFNITNKDLIKFGMSFKGILYLGIIVIISFIAIFIEVSIITYMANKSYKKEKTSLIEATINSISILPKNIGPYMIKMIIMAGIIGPLLGIGLSSSLIRNLSIPSFIKIELFKTAGGKIFFGIIITSFIIILLRWIMAIPSMVIEDGTIKTAFKNSISMYKDSKYKILGFTILWLVINLLLKLIILVLYLIIGYFIISVIGTSSYIGNLFVVIYSFIFFVGYVIISVITLPLFISFLVELYYKYRKYNVKERQFKSTLIYDKNRLCNTFAKKKKYFNFIVAVLFSTIVLIMGGVAVFEGAYNSEVLITAHRGSSLTAPENSISSVKNAIAEGADYVEIDVMTTKDSEVVLFHDSTLKRINGSNEAIKDMTLDEIGKVDNGSYFSSEFKGEKIPTLKEILKITKGKIKVNIELKPMGSDDELAKLVSEIIKDMDIGDEVVVTSIDYDILQQFEEYSPFVKTGYILSFGIGDFRHLNVDFLSVEYSLASRNLILLMHAMDKEVHVWTINDSDRVTTLHKLGVNNIITDNVPLVKEWLSVERNYDNLTGFIEIIKSIIKYVQV